MANTKVELHFLFFFLCSEKNHISTNLVKSILTEINLDVLAVQESELEPDTDMNLVSIPGYIYRQSPIFSLVTKNTF